MSDHIKRLAHRVVNHPDFKRAVTDDDKVAFANIIASTLRDDFGGDRLYVPKNGDQVSKEERNALIRSQFSGNNKKELAKKFGVTVRQVGNILNNK